MSNDRYTKVIIYSGTTEGRQLSTLLSGAGIYHTVCVATQYGQIMQESDEYTKVCEGRLNEKEMVELYGDNTEYVVDATHPYATEVTENIYKSVEQFNLDAAQDNSVFYIRILRESIKKQDDSKLSCFENAKQCADKLESVNGNILLTTGSKDIATFTEAISDKSRIYARVLPTEESIGLCLQAGIAKDHIIAMHGPFSTFLNRALIKQYDIQTLVTKDSGANGGFAEKVEAALEEKINCFCINRPTDERGITVKKAFEIIAGRRTLTVNIVGIGMGERCGMTIGALDAVNASQLIFGADRLLMGFKNKISYPYYLSKDIIPVLEEKMDDVNEISILFSGDIGFYSGAKGMEKALKVWGEEKNIDITVIKYPGISSVSYLSAYTGVPYSEAEIYSLHGKDDSAFDDVVDIIQHVANTFILVSSGDDISKLAGMLIEIDDKISFTVGMKMSYPDESIITIDIKEALKYSGPGLYTLLVTNPSPKDKLLIPYINDDEFIRDKSPMTKELIRHESIRLLGLHNSDILYDVGSGTGSVSIEAAGLSKELKVYSIEKKADAVALEKRNIEAFGINNIELVEGEAPDALATLDPPNAVFIGGSGKRLEEILDALKLKTKGNTVRIVVNAVSLETMNELIALRSRGDVHDYSLVQINCSNIKEAGEYHLMQANNPVMIAAFNLKS